MFVVVLFVKEDVPEQSGPLTQKIRNHHKKIGNVHAHTKKNKMSSAHKRGAADELTSVAAKKGSSRPRKHVRKYTCFNGEEIEIPTKITENFDIRTDICRKFPKDCVSSLVAMLSVNVEEDNPDAIPEMSPLQLCRALMLAKQLDLLEHPQVENVSGHIGAVNLEQLREHKNFFSE
jgi:hypothetical protein